MAEEFGIERLDWDDWNREHVRKHQVSQDEVAQVITGRPVFLESYKNRLAAIGPTSSERMVVVIIGPNPVEPGLWYVFSARPASRKERAIYRDTRGHEQ